MHSCVCMHILLCGKCSPDLVVLCYTTCFYPKDKNTRLLLDDPKWCDVASALRRAGKNARTAAYWAAPLSHVSRTATIGENWSKLRILVKLRWGPRVIGKMAATVLTDKTRQSAYADSVVYPACPPASSTARSLVNHVPGSKS